jgi:hypothetical protein
VLYKHHPSFDDLLMPLKSVMLLYIHEMHLTHLPGDGEANNHNSVGLRFLDLSFNRLSEGNCARILAGAVQGPLEGLDLGTSN